MNEHHPLRKQIEEMIELTDEEFAFVLEHFQRRMFKKHQIVLHEGDYAKYDFFVLKGLMRVSRLDTDGKEHLCISRILNSPQINIT